MGNRATIVFTNKDCTEFSPSIYLHWNGGPESVYQFLDELDRREVRADHEYEAARFVQIVGEFMDQNYRTGLSLGISNGPARVSEIDRGQWDNGTYLVCRDGTRNVRRFSRDVEWPEDRVASEEKAARRHKYMQDGGFRATWGDKPNESEHFAKKQA